MHQAQATKTLQIFRSEFFLPVLTYFYQKSMHPPITLKYYHKHIFVASNPIPKSGQKRTSKSFEDPEAEKN